MATRTFNLSWMRQYRANTNAYHLSNNPIQVGGANDLQSYLGIPPAVRTALQTSSTATTMSLKIYVTDPTPEWDVGRHKLAGGSEPTSTTMPWYNFLKAVFNNSTGWITIPLTNDFMNDYKNGVYQGLVLYSVGNAAHYGSASNTGSTRAYIEVTGTWNTRPNPPGSIITPTAATVADTSLLVQWTPATDPDGDPLYYQIAFRNTPTSSWQYFHTGIGETSYVINTANAIETTKAIVGVRAWDAEISSEYTYSPEFTISHYQPPSKPTQLNPVNGALLDRTQVVRFGWKHNGLGTQAGFRLMWRVVNPDDSRGSWNYIPSNTTFQNSTNQYYDMPASTLPNSNIEWTVITKDQQGNSSPEADYVIFRASEPTNAPIITSPANLSTVSTTRVKVQWSSLDQIEYDLALLDDSDNILSSHTETSGVKVVIIPYDLTNNTTYKIRLRVKESNTLIWSDYVTHTFTTSFTPPHSPVIDFIEEAGDGIINIHYHAADANILPPFVDEDGNKAPRVSEYNITDPSQYTLNSIDSVTVNGYANRGIGVRFTTEHTPLDAGLLYRVYTTLDVQGGRLLIQALDADNNSLSLNATANSMASSPTGDISASLPLPANTATLRVIFYTTADNTNTVTHSNCQLKLIPATPTERVSIFRREYTQDGSSEWIEIGKNLPLSGSFLDYTPASGTLYEYKLVAYNDTNETSSESNVEQYVTSYDVGILQESDNLENLIYLNPITTRDGTFEVESELQSFAGRVYPIREYGEHESHKLSLEWEVDTYLELMNYIAMLKKRKLLLYRDGTGRRYWVTTTRLSYSDKPVCGFNLSGEFDITNDPEGVVT